MQIKCKRGNRLIFIHQELFKECTRFNAQRVQTRNAKRKSTTKEERSAFVAHTIHFVALQKFVLNSDIGAATTNLFI